MEFRCINAKGMEGILTQGRVYKGKYAKHLTYVKIYQADDKKVGHFTDDRFEEVVDTVLSEPEVKINHYFMEVEKK